MTTALYDLRAVQLGLSSADMDCITMGMFSDMFIERANDDFNYAQIATPDDYADF